MIIVYPSALRQSALQPLLQSMPPELLARNSATVSLHSTSVLALDSHTQAITIPFDNQSTAARMTSNYKRTHGAPRKRTV